MREARLKRGVFISFEGIEGSGKTTQARLLKEHLERKAYKVILTKEPGGSRIGEKIKDILLSPQHREIDEITELLLYFAGRRQHIKELILPSLEKGITIITDRFIDSTRAYQGYARGIDLDFIDSLNKVASMGIMPDLTILLDIDVDTGLKRNRGANKVDRLELEDIEFHKRVKEGYSALAETWPERIKVIDASKGIEETHNRIVEVVEEFLKAR